MKWDNRPVSRPAVREYVIASSDSFVGELIKACEINVSVSDDDRLTVVDPLILIRKGD